MWFTMKKGDKLWKVTYVSRNYPLYGEKISTVPGSSRSSVVDNLKFYINTEEYEVITIEEVV